MPYKDPKPHLLVPKGINNYTWHYCLPCVMDAWAEPSDESPAQRALSRALKEITSDPIENIKLQYSRGLMDIEQMEQAIEEIIYEG